MSKIPRAATYEREPGGLITFRTPYSAGWVRGVKDVPPEYREYDPDDGHAWTIYPPFADAALQMLFRFFPDAREERAGSQRSYTQTKGWADGDPYAVLYLLPTAPPPVVDASFRALAKQYHPDHGGDASKMRAITEARDIINRRLGA